MFQLWYALAMFIKEIVKKNPTSDKTFTYHRLMEAVRTPRGPRQRIILNLGRLDIPREDWKTLANRIEEILSGQQTYLIPPPHIESLAQHYAGLLRQKEMRSIPVPQEAEWEKIDLNSLSQSEFRTIGGEAVAYDAFNRLGVPEILAHLGFKEEQIHQAALLIIGRLLHPSSERETAMWGKELSALDELLGADFKHLSNNALYRISDELVKHRKEQTGVETGVSPKGFTARRPSFRKFVSLSINGDGAEGSQEQRSIASVEHTTNTALDPYDSDGIYDQREGGTDTPEADRRPEAIPFGDISCLGTISQTSED